jgi:hypothetical protein
MKNQTLLVAAVSAATLLAATAASAQATRTWVSGVGDDANPCSRTAPCKTLQGAISKTASGGEISILDPGGVGGVTITKAISINGEWAGEAGVLVAGTNAIIINAGANDVVNLRGLFVEGLSTGLSGVNILSAREVHMQDMVIRDFKSSSTNAGNGVYIQPSANSIKVTIDNSLIANNGSPTTGAGVFIRPNAGAATVSVAITRSNLPGNSNGVKADNAGGGSGEIKVQIDRTSASGNLGNGFNAKSTGSAPIQMLITNSLASNNGANGARVDGANATVTVGRSTFTNNTLGGLGLANGGTLNSYRDNYSILNGGSEASTTPVTPS